jgi:hypothetical protein
LKKIPEEDDIDTSESTIHIRFDLIKINIELYEDQGIHHTNFIEMRYYRSIHRVNLSGLRDLFRSSTSVITIPTILWRMIPSILTATIPIVIVITSSWRRWSKTNHTSMTYIKRLFPGPSSPKIPIRSYSPKSRFPRLWLMIIWNIYTYSILRENWMMIDDIEVSISSERWILDLIGVWYYGGLRAIAIYVSSISRSRWSYLYDKPE